MGDGGFPRGFTGGTLDIQMNPLEITGCLGKLVDPVLIDKNPVTDPQLGSHGRLQLFRSADNAHEFKASSLVAPFGGF